MKLQSLTEEELQKLRGKHAVVIVSNGKIQLAELPKYGMVEIHCSDGIAKNIYQKDGAKLN